MKCRVCGNYCNRLTTITNTIGNVSVLYEKAIVKNDNELNIDIYSCNKCQHYQIEKSIEDSYYDDYVMTTSFSPSIIDLAEFELSALLKYLDSNNRDLIVEVGSGDGFFLSIAKRSFKKQVGFEPSKAFCLAAKKNGVDLINEYYNPTEIYPFLNNINALISRQVFEHVDNPLEMLISLKQYFKINGIGLIEVPNGLKIIEGSRYYEIFNDHLNYFTPNSLSKLIMLSGYELLSINSHFNDDYLVAIFRLSREIKLDFFSINVDYQITRILESYDATNKRVALFGIGAKGQQIYHRIKNKVDIKKIFDNDENKVGRFPANCNFRISKPNVLDLSEIDLIIVTALTYKEEIIHQLKEDFNFRGYIMLWEDAML